MNAARRTHRQVDQNIVQAEAVDNQRAVAGSAPLLSVLGVCYVGDGDGGGGLFAC